MIKKLLLSIFASMMYFLCNAEVIATGFCNADFVSSTWTLTDDSTLTVSGKGDVEGFHLMDEDLYLQVKRLIFEDGITAIKEYSCHRFLHLEEVIIAGTVTEVGQSSFYGLYKLNKVKILNAKITIGVNAFIFCPNLLSVDLGDNVVEIKTSAFDQCYNLKSVNLGKNLKKIGVQAFNYCTQLCDVVFPESLESIGDYAFQGCSSLRTADLIGHLYEIGNDAFFGCSSLESVILGGSLKRFGTYIFGACHKLSSVEFSEGIEEIGYSMFGGSDLQSISFPSSLKRIGANAFYQCWSLADVQFNEGLEYIGKSAFVNNNSLISIQLPTSLKIIDNGAFSNCWKLKIPDMSELVHLDTIGHSAFAGSGAFFALGSGPVKVKLPSNISYISPTAFNMDESIIELQIENNGRFYTQDGILYDKDGTLMHCPAFLQKSNLDIPEGIQVISSEAFRFTSFANREGIGLRNIHIPRSTKYIGTRAFEQSDIETINIPFGIDYFQPCLFGNCQSLTNIMIESPEPPKIGLDAFAFVPRDKLVVNIPKGCKDIYQQAPGWDQFENIEEIDMCPVGDINEDGRINVIDINMLSNYILSGSADNKYYSDVNRDDHIDILDIRGVSNFVTSNSFTSQEHNCVDLGLPSGTLWAETNIGAKRPSDFGDYFAWGETEPKETYTWGNYKWNRNDSLSIETEVGYDKWGNEELQFTRKDDPAYVLWGWDWQVPTSEMIHELEENCSFELIYKEGVLGMNIVGKNNNSIFLPHAGYINENGLQWLNDEGNYLTRNTYRGSLYNNFYASVGSFPIYCGYTVRPVKKPVKRNMQKSLHRSISDVYAEPIEITEGEEKSFSISLNSVKDITGLQFDLVLPVGLSLVGVKQNVGESTHLLKYQKQKDGSIRILEYSVENDVIEQFENGILEITVKADEGLQSDAKIQFNDIIMATTGNDCIKTSFETDVRAGSMTSIQHAIESKQDAAVYNVSGTQIKSMKASDLMKGSYIINGKKTIVK